MLIVCEIGKVVDLFLIFIVYGYLVCFEKKGLILCDLIKLWVIELILEGLEKIGI